ncbi:hypothetical protein [Streptosporangium sp. NPDC001681]|uniref:hypothetical protein n=1 Tax=Streptosporangium sp. NPDC001681 TaxID=3154395 RepID=UPI003331C256
MRRLAMVAVTMAITVATFLTGVSAAHAAGPDPDEPTTAKTAAAALAAAPSCIYREVRDRYPAVDEIYVWNRCGQDYWLKVIIAFGPDSSCRFIQSGHGFVFFFWPAPGQYDGLQVC